MSYNFFNKFNKGTTNFVTAGMQLKYIADCKPDSVAVIYIDKEDKASFITWGQLDIQSNKLAWMLKEKNVGEDAIIMVGWPNSIEHIIAAFAIWKIGACYLPISHKTAGDELIQISEMISPKVAFAEFDVPETPLTFNIKKMYEAIKDMPEEMPKDILSKSNMISLSGGTSGKLKLIRQNNPSGMSDEIFKMWFSISGMDFEQSQLLLGPLFHGAPHTAAFNGLFSGNTLVIPRNLCPDNIVKLIKRYQIEYAQIVPILLNRIIKLPHIQKDDFASLKAMCHASGFCSDWLKQKWIDLLAPEKVYEIYSMTELIGLTCIRGDEWLKHLGSVGLPVGEGKISIRDKNGKEVQPFELGEIYMTSLSCDFSTEYMNKAQLENTFDGYKSVGDFGYVDNEGYLYFVDRRNDVLVTGGENVFVNEVETALLRHEDIMDVIVVGIPDEEWGRRIHAVIEAKREIPKEELVSFLKQYLSPYKIPKSFEYVKNLRRMCNGKTDRDRVLKDCMSRGV